MASIQKPIDVDVPVRTAYNQWTQFEEFPRFMEGVEEFASSTIADCTGARRSVEDEEWDAVITEQIPDERVAWRNTTGADNAGVVTFHHLSPNTTRVMLQIEYDPQGLVENVGSALGLVEHRVEGDLKRFKEFVESQGTETGAWRGEIDVPRAALTSLTR